jgi:hypothetical protein
LAKLAVLVRHIHHVAQHHGRARHCARLAAERHGDLVGQVGIVELRERLLAEGERRLEPGHQPILWPSALTASAVSSTACGAFMSPNALQNS